MNFPFVSAAADNMWTCREGSPKDIINEVKIPKYLKEDVKLKDFLAAIQRSNVKNIVEFLKESTYSNSYQKLKYLAMNIAYFAKLFTNQCRNYYILSRELGKLDDFGVDFKKALLGECVSLSSGRLLRFCLDGGLFTKEQVFERIKPNMTFDLCFFVVTALDWGMKHIIFDKCPPNKQGKKLNENDIRTIDNIITDTYDKDSLEYYIKNDQVEEVRKIIEEPKYKKDKELPTPYGVETEEARYLLDFACFYHSEKVIKLLIEKDFKLTTTALLNAILAGDIEIVKLLVSTDKVKISPGSFSVAIKYHRWDIANYILQNADCQRQLGMGLSQMIQWRNPRAVMYGIQTGRPVNDPNVKEGPLSVACRAGEVNLAVALIDKGASVLRLPDYYPHSPLTLACQYGHSDLAKILIQKGADPTAVLLGRTALIAACEYGYDTELVEYLLKQDGDIYQEEYSSDPRGYEKIKRQYDNHREFRFPTALCYAARSGCLETVELLLKYKPAIIGSLPNGETLMTWAVRSNNVDIVRLLDESGASLTQKSTPPLLSIPSANDHVYRYLFDHGANDRIPADETYPLYKMPYTFERSILKKTYTEDQLKAFTYANQAVSALKLRDTANATKMINDALHHDYQCVDAYRAAGILLLKLKDVRISTMMIRAALSIATTEEQKQRCLRALAKCARIQGDFKTEIDALSEAYRIGDRLAGKKLLVAYCASIGRGRSSPEGQETVESLEALIKHLKAPQETNNLKFAQCIIEYCKEKTVHLKADKRYIDSCLGDTRGSRGHSGPDFALSYFPEIVSTLRPGMKFGLAAHDFSKKKELLRTFETSFGRMFELKESDAAYEAGDQKKQEEIANKFLETARGVLGKAKFLEAINNLLLSIECFTRAEKPIPFPVYSNLATAAAQAGIWPLARAASVLTLSVKPDHAKTYEKLPRIAKEMGATGAEEKLTQLAEDVKKGGDFKEFAKRANSLLSVKCFTTNEDGDALEEMNTKVSVGVLGWKVNQ